MPIIDVVFFCFRFKLLQIATERRKGGEEEDRFKITTMIAATTKDVIWCIKNKKWIRRRERGKIVLLNEKMMGLSEFFKERFHFRFGFVVWIASRNRQIKKKPRCSQKGHPFLGNWKGTCLVGKRHAFVLAVHHESMAEVHILGPRRSRRASRLGGAVVVLALDEDWEGWAGLWHPQALLLRGGEPREARVGFLLPEVVSLGAAADVPDGRVLFLCGRAHRGGDDVVHLEDANEFHRPCRFVVVVVVFFLGAFAGCTFGVEEALWVVAVAPLKSRRLYSAELVQGLADCAVCASFPSCLLLPVQELVYAFQPHRCGLVFAFFGQVQLYPAPDGVSVLQRSRVCFLELRFFLLHVGSINKEREIS